MDCKKPKRVPEQRKITYQGRVFALVDEEAQETPTVVSGTLLINGDSIKVLFDLVLHILYFGYFVESLESHCMRKFDAKFLGKNSYGTIARIAHETPSIRVNLARKYLSAKVYIPCIKDFDMILGIDWLEAHFATKKSA